MAKLSVSAKSIIVLSLIAVVCVGLLAILNDLLYVAPDMTVFNSTVQGEYSEVSVNTMKIKKGKVVAAAEGVTADNKQVVGLYITSNSVSPAGKFTIVVIVDKATNCIIGSAEIVDGSTGGYSYDESKLDLFNGKEITSANVFDTSTELIISGATSSSKTVRNAFIVAANYYWVTYLGGQA